MNSVPTVHNELKHSDLGKPQAWRPSPSRRIAHSSRRPPRYRTTDEIGFHAEEHPHYVTDVHATIMHQLGLNPRRLELPEHKRLKRDYGHPIGEIMA